MPAEHKNLRRGQHARFDERYKESRHNDHHGDQRRSAEQAQPELLQGRLAAFRALKAGEQGEGEDDDDVLNYQYAERDAAVEGVDLSPV